MITNDDIHLPEDELIAAAEGESLSVDAERHIASCASCSRLIMDVQQALSLLKHAPAPSLSNGLRRDLMQTYRSKHHKCMPLQRVLSWRIPVYQAACLVAGAILAWQVFTSNPQASHQHVELLAELPAFTAAMSELTTGQYYGEVREEVTTNAHSQHRPVLNETGSRQAPAEWISPSSRQTPGVDSCDATKN